MSVPETPAEVREMAQILRAGRWYIAELEELNIAMQGESEQEALDKLVSRWEQYTSVATPFLCSEPDYATQARSKNENARL